MRKQSVLCTLTLSLLLGISAAAAQSTSTDPNKANTVRKVGPDTWPTTAKDAGKDRRSSNKIEAGQKSGSGKVEASSDPLALKPQTEKDQSAETKKPDPITDAMKAADSKDKDAKPTTTGGTAESTSAATRAAPSPSGSTQTTATTPAANQPAPPAAQQSNAAAQTTPSQGVNSSTDAKSAASIRLGTNAEGRVALNEDQRREVSTAIRKISVQPVTNISFSVRVGAVVPRDVRLVTVSTELVNVLPQFRGYRFFRTREEIVIVEPDTLKIVALVPLGGTATASAPSRPTTPASRTTARSATRTTTGSARVQEDIYVDRRPVLIEREITYPRRRTIIIERVPPVWMN